jgi:hypothetical protein
MAMKSIALFILVAVFSIATIAASAKTVTNSPRNANEQSVIGVAGPPPAKRVADTSSAPPGNQALRKAKVRTPPPMHDPN